MNSGLKLPESPKTAYERIRTCPEVAQKKMQVLTDDGVVRAVHDPWDSDLDTAVEDVESFGQDD